MDYLSDDDRRAEFWEDCANTALWLLSAIGVLLACWW